MQPGLDRADGDAREVLDFLQLVSFRVVQQHDHAVFLAELLQCRIQPPEFLQPFPVGDGIQVAGQAREPVARQVALVDEVHTLPDETPVLIDEQVVHHPGQP